MSEPPPTKEQTESQPQKSVAVPPNEWREIVDFIKEVKEDRARGEVSSKRPGDDLEMSESEGEVQISPKNKRRKTGNGSESQRPIEAIEDLSEDSLSEAEPEDDESEESDLEGEFEAYRLNKDKKGPALKNEKFANVVNNMYKEPMDRAKIAELIEKNPRPENIPLMKAPAMNEEITINTRDLKFKEARYAKMQAGIRASSAIAAKVYDKYGDSSKEIRHWMRDMLRINVMIHQEIAQTRRDNVRPVLASRNQKLCDSRRYQKIESNDLLLGKEIHKQVEEIGKVDRLQKPEFPKNGKWGQFQAPGYNKYWKKNKYGNKRTGGDNPSYRGRGRGRRQQRGGSNRN